MNQNVDEIISVLNYIIKYNDSKPRKEMLNQLRLRYYAFLSHIKHFQDYGEYLITNGYRRGRHLGYNDVIFHILKNRYFQKEISIIGDIDAPISKEKEMTIQMIVDSFEGVPISNMYELIYNQRRYTQDKVIPELSPKILDDDLIAFNFKENYV